MSAARTPSGSGTVPRLMKNPTAPIPMNPTNTQIMYTGCPPAPSSTASPARANPAAKANSPQKRPSARGRSSGTGLTGRVVTGRIVP